MNKPLFLLVGGSIFFLILVLAGIFIYDDYLNKEENLRLPNRISSYWDSGYLKINPETILASLENGDTKVFTPLLENPQDVNVLTDMSIHWTQDDFLKIASAVGQYVWNDPMDLEDWSIYSIDFEGDCDDPNGFYLASITYFNMDGKRYATRLIEIYPYLGWIGWGDGETYPKPILQKWKSVDLSGAKITADDAFRMVKEDAKVRFQLKDCEVIMGSPQYSDPKNWYLAIFSGTPDLILYIINLDTGDYAIR